MNHSRATRAIDLSWLILLAATLLTFGVAESGFANAGFAAVLFIFALAIGKVTLVLLHFMELKRAPLVWRLLLFSWLAVVTTGILIAWRIGSQAA